MSTSGKVTVADSGKEGSRSGADHHVSTPYTLSLTRERRWHIDPLCIAKHALCSDGG
jgi:hypothetical protein